MSIARRRVPEELTRVTELYLQTTWEAMTALGNLIQEKIRADEIKPLGLHRAIQYDETPTKLILQLHTGTPLAIRATTGVATEEIASEETQL